MFQSQKNEISTLKKQNADLQKQLDYFRSHANHQNEAALARMKTQHQSQINKETDKAKRQVAERLAV